MNSDRLAMILLCPRCQTSLGVPGDVISATALECPVCDAEFALAAAEVRELPMARRATSSESRSHFTTPLPPGIELIEQLNGARIDSLHEASRSQPQLAEPQRESFEPTFEQLNETGDPADTSEAPVDELVVDIPAPAELSAPDDAPKPFEDLSVELPEMARYAESAASHAEPERPASEIEDEFAIGVDDPADDEAAAEIGEEAELSATAIPGDRGYDFSPYLRPARRRGSPVRTLVGIVGGGVGGLLLAGYALVWLRGIDLFHMADWLPAGMLPASAQLADARRDVDPGREPASDDNGADESAATRGAAEESLADEPDAEAPLSRETSLAGGEVEVDPAVTPASGTEEASPAGEGAAPTIAESPVGEPASQTPPLVSTVTPATWPATPIVADLISPRLFSLAELTEAVTAAKNAGRDFASGSLGDRNSVRAMGQAYMKLCAAAERYTLTDPRAYGSLLFTQQALAKQQMRQVAGNVDRRGDLAVIASRWLAHPSRQNNGVLLVGRVSDMHPRGQWTEYTLDLNAGGKVVQAAVLLDQLRFTTGDEAAVFGVIVTEPQQRIAGYAGDAPLVVVGGDYFDPAEFASQTPEGDSEFDIEGFLNGE